MSEAPEFPRRASTASGTAFAWSVEACLSPNIPPKQVAGMLLDGRWRQVGFLEGAGGVPDGPRWLHEGRAFGLLSYPSAQALRWWFVAHAHATGREDIGLQTRLVKHQVKYERSATPIEAVGIADFRDDGTDRTAMGEKP